jgi:Type II CAAX prenyl endopeptidase Rce1-like
LRAQPAPAEISPESISLFIREQRAGSSRRPSQKGVMSMRSLLHRSLLVVQSVIIGIAIALFGQGIWSLLVFTNLTTSPAIPWSVGAMAVVLWLLWQYLGGRWWPRGTSQSRHRYLRANAVPAPVFGWALLAGATSVAALAGTWIVMAQLVRMPGSVLPDLSQFPLATAVLMIGMGALVSPLLEQAGMWGYCQVMLEGEFPAPVAVVISSAVFALLPHPPMDAALWAKLLFFFLTGATFGTIAYLANSILPGLVVHIAALLAFFILVWPHDTARRLVAEGGADAWFWIHAAQAIIFAVLAVAVFRRLARMTARRRAV